MSNPSMIHDARQLATRAHRGQTDKAGAAYIDHPRRVADGALAHADPAWQAIHEEYARDLRIQDAGEVRRYGAVHSQQQTLLAINCRC